LTPSQRVLVVDADRYFRETIRDALTEEGIICELAGSGAEAQKAIEDPRVACVVLDVRVESPHAIGVLEALLAERPALRVIAVSGHTDQELVLEALRRGASQYRAKPLLDEELCLAVKRALEGYDALSRWQATRERIARLADLGDEIGESAGAGSDCEALTVRAATALVDVLGVSRIDAERALQESVSSRDTLEGAGGAEDLGLLRLFAGGVRRWLDPERNAAASPASSVSDAQVSEFEQQVELLREIAEAVTREIEPERLLAASLRPVARVSAARAASIFLIDNVTGRLAREAGIDGTDVERSDLPRDRGLTGGCLQSGALVATDRPERDPRFDPEVDTPEGGAVGPMLIVPLRMRDRVLGVARVFPAVEVGASARLAELLAAPLSAATRNVLLYRSLLESVEDVVRARREAEMGRRP
jgi:FixJ family two-component response regulator